MTLQLFENTCSVTKSAQLRGPRLFRAPCTWSFPCCHFTRSNPDGGRRCHLVESFTEHGTEIQKTGIHIHLNLSNNSRGGLFRVFLGFRGCLFQSLGTQRLRGLGAWFISLCVWISERLGKTQSRPFCLSFKVLVPLQAPFNQKWQPFYC